MELALGTAQFGMAYGIAGNQQAVPLEEARAILECAARRGVTTLDTAPSYGNIERELGALIRGLDFKVVSKIPFVPSSLSNADACTWVRSNAFRSKDRLGDALVGLICHSATDLTGERGSAIWHSLRTIGQQAGIRVGGAFYSPKECFGAHRELRMGLAQVPGNALDQRLAAFGAADAEGLEVHMRSVFLQGLLLMDDAVAAAKLPFAATAIGEWRAFCRAERLSPLVAALSVARGFSVVSKVIIGVNSLEQFREVADAWHSAEALVAKTVSCDDTMVIDPRNWNDY